MVPRGARQVNGAPYGERRAVRTWWHEVYRNIDFIKNILLYFLYWAFWYVVLILVKTALELVWKNLYIEFGGQ